MFVQEFKSIFQKVQGSAASHQNCLTALINLYNKTPYDTFRDLFIKALSRFIKHSIDNGIYTKRVLSFVSMFCADITKREEKDHNTHEFLSTVIEELLEWSSIDLYDIRYNCCFLISRILQDIGEDVDLEIKLIEDMQAVLLDRFGESKVPMRLIAMEALARLQDFDNLECPVVQAYIDTMTGSSALVRREAVIRVAPSVLNLHKIRDRVRDCDSLVRGAAFQKCAEIGPKPFKIADKQMILMSGFDETDSKAKHVFLNVLLPKWLTFYEGNYLKFVNSLHLIADEEDVKKMVKLCKKVIHQFYRTQPLDDLIAMLPINENKLINIEELTNEVTLFWRILVSLLRDSDDMDEHLDRVIPELTPFCNYLEEIIKSKLSEKGEEWKRIEHEFDILNMLYIAKNYDYSDEVGRRTMHSLTMKCLLEQPSTFKITKIMVSLASKCSNSIDMCINDMCMLISDIREPLTDSPPLPINTAEHNYKIAEIRVQIIAQKAQQEDALERRDYIEAQKLEDNLIKLAQHLEELQKPVNHVMVRVQKNDPDTLGRCLDLLASVLKLGEVRQMTPSLTTARDEFVVPLITNESVELQWKVFRCLVLFTLIDKEFAMEFTKVICIPLTLYRSTPTLNISTLVQSIQGVSDMIALYGLKIFGDSVYEKNESNGKRKLYSENENDTTIKSDNIALTSILEIFLTMLDDEHELIRHKAVLAIGALFYQRIKITSPVLSRLLLKWFNPITASQDSCFQGYLGSIIEEYFKSHIDCHVLNDCIVLSLSTVAKAPKTSPLIDIDSDSMIRFFAEVVNINMTKDELKIAFLDLCMRLSEETCDKVVTYLTKLFLHLNFNYIGADGIRELINRAEMLLQNITEKSSIKQMNKLLLNLRHLQSNLRDCTNLPEENSVCSTVNENEKRSSINSKRRKSRLSRSCVVLLERIPDCEKSDDTLHTILEDNMELEEDHNLTKDSIIYSENSADKDVIISNTSDSELNSEIDVPIRKLTRIRKKRILSR